MCCPRTGKIFFRMALIGLSLLATVKVLFFFIDIDEQYAVAMAYRMARGDRMFLEMWEPHQTSGFLAFALVRIFLAVTGGVDGIVIYLRLAGVLFQAGVSLFLYTTLKRICSEETAFFAALFFYNTLAKYNQSIDFTNMLMWFSMLMFLFLVRYFMEEEGNWFYLVLAGVCTSLLVLSYPTCILSVLPVCAGIWRMSAGRKRWLCTGVYLGTCAVCGGGWLLYFLSHMTVSEFVYGVSQMLTDGSHSKTFLQKLAGYGKDFGAILPFLLAALALAFVMWGTAKIVFQKKSSFLLWLLWVSMAEQLFVWLRLNRHIKFPGIFYLVLLAVGIYRYGKRESYGIARDDRAYQALFWFGSMTAVWLLLAALWASNMGLMESNEYVMIGMTAALAYLEQERRSSKAWWLLILVTLAGLAIFRKGYLQYYIWGTDTIFVEKQKALDGPLKGVYCRYSDGYAYNQTGQLLEQYIPRGSTVMYVGVQSFVYLQGEYEVSNFSTISTPVIDERLLEYWDRYPGKYPEYIVWDLGVPYESQPSDAAREEMLRDSVLLAEDEGIQIYAVRP